MCIHFETCSTVCGTPNYIAPEVLNMKGHGFEADVWAIGCIMYAMLAGCPPFETSSLSDTYHRITNNLYTIPDRVSEPAQKLIQWLLRPRPQDRPTLDQILTHEFFTSGRCKENTHPEYQSNNTAILHTYICYTPFTLQFRVCAAWATLRLNAHFFAPVPNRYYCFNNKALYRPYVGW